MSPIVAATLKGLGFVIQDPVCQIPIRESGVHPRGEGAVDIVGPALEQALRAMPLDFDSLPSLFEGQSKSVRQWTDKVVVIRFKPTIYSYTMNRYGEVAGTDLIRLKFTSEIFRRMAEVGPRGGIELQTAFLGEYVSENGPLMVQKRVSPCNIETRIKRYHIGSPLHRYRYTENYQSTQSCGAVKAWSRLDTPIVCFDWRHPLHDQEGNRLADEPLSDDYAGLWMQDVAHAKTLARGTFLWMEEFFEAAGIRLIDMCLFIDETGRTIYGEISPDCMRARIGLGDPAAAIAADKDVWRTGGAPEQIRERYETLYRRLFRVP